MRRRVFFFGVNVGFPKHSPSPPPEWKSLIEKKKKSQSQNDFLQWSDYWFGWQVRTQPPNSGRSAGSKWWIFIGLFPVFQPCPFLCALHCLSKTTIEGNLSCGALQNGPAEKLNTSRGLKVGGNTHTHRHNIPLHPVVLDDLWPVYYPFQRDKCFMPVCEGEAGMAAHAFVFLELSQML